MSSKKIIFIVGPTAVGKSQVALKAAKCLNGEIVCCDSMQVYQEISIASNKPGAEEIKQVPHHVFDVTSVTSSFDVAQYARLANKAIQKILDKDKTPVVVGGSGMYFQILLDGIFEAEGQDKNVREWLNKEVRALGNKVMHERLREVDPISAGKIHENDERRVIRALEVYEVTKQPMSSLKEDRDGLWGRYDILIFGLRMQREKLYEKINSRVDKMMEMGLEREVSSLKGAPLSLTASHLIGVKEILEYFNGEGSLSDALERIKQNTRRFAKRQMTWFKKDERIQWIDVDNLEIGEIVKRIENKVKH